MNLPLKLPFLDSWAARSVALTLAASLSPAWAQAPAAAASAPVAAASSAEARYAKERQRCLDGKSGQEQATCLKEAGASLAEARRGELGRGEGNAAQRAANATQRCQAVAAADRSDCERMARGEGSVSGSVSGGGVVKEIVTPVPAKPN